jgi:hypothetical protein
VSFARIVPDSRRKEGKRLLDMSHMPRMSRRSNPAFPAAVHSVATLTLPRTLGTSQRLFKVVVEAGALASVRRKEQG